MNIEGEKKLIDFAYLDELSEGDVEFKISMIEFFIENAPTSLAEMNLHYKGKNFKSLREVAHKFKPQLGFMGISSISEDVEFIEQSAASESNLEKLPEFIEKTERVVLLAIEQLKSELEKLQFQQ